MISSVVSAAPLALIFPDRMLAYYYPTICIISCIVGLDVLFYSVKRKVIITTIISYIIVFSMTQIPKKYTDLKNYLEYTTCFEERDYKAWVWIRKNLKGEAILTSPVMNWLPSAGVRAFPHNQGRITTLDDRWTVYKILMKGRNSINETEVKVLAKYLKEMDYRFIYITKSNCFKRIGFSYKNVRKLNFTHEVYNQSGVQIFAINFSALPLS